MGTTLRFFQSPGVTLLIIVISITHATNGIMANPPNFNISPVTTFGLTDLFFPGCGLTLPCNVNTNGEGFA